MLRGASQHQTCCVSAATVRDDPGSSKNGRPDKESTPRMIRSTARNPGISVSAGLRACAAVLVVSVLSICVNAQDQAAPPQLDLTEAEWAWLEAHPVIRVAPDPDFPPFESFDAKGKYLGIAADYIALLDSRLPVRFEIVRYKSWPEALERAQARDVDMFAAAMETTQRSEYMAFTVPHIRMASVIIGTTDTTATMKLEHMDGKRVVVVSGYAWHDLIERDYPKVELITAPDTASALRMTSFGIADAMVGDQATSTYYIGREGLTNLRIAGQPKYRYDLSLGVRNDWPELAGILDKVLDGITENERAAIIDKWITLKRPSLLKSRKFWTIVGAFTVVITFVIVSILVWNRVLKGQVAQRTAELNEELGWRKEAEIELRKHRDHLDELVQIRTAELSEANEKMKRDLEAAALVQQSLLPSEAPDVPGAQVAWQYRPCDELAGDILNVFRLGRSHIGVYVADVSGHGVAASLLSVAISRVMTPEISSSSLLIRQGEDGGPPRIIPPAEVAAELNQRFPMEEPANRYFTLLYGVIDVTTRTFRFVAAGHPPVISVVPGQPPKPLELAAMAIGWIPDTQFEEREHTLSPGERLYLYSDGVPEAMNADMKQFGDHRMIEFINETRMDSLEASVGALMVRVEDWCGTNGPLDDVSILGVELA